MDHPEGSKRSVYYDPASLGGPNVRYVGSSRGPGYVDKTRTARKPLGYIEQVLHTYAYFDGNYAVMNEHQLIFGECTNGSKFQPKPGPDRIFYSAELSRVAAERCTTAREAITLMGKLMKEHGYYATGETLLVGDTKEAWVFEMCAVPNQKGGICWFGPDKAATTAFVPFYAGAADLPKVYQTGYTDTFDRETAWWAFNFVSNWANLKYSYMIKDIKAKQKEVEDEEFAVLSKIDDQALELYNKDPKLAKKFLTKYSSNNGDKVVKDWWALGDYLIAKYNDGYINKPKMATDVGYPKWWLDEVGYKNGPTTYKKHVE